MNTRFDITLSLRIVKDIGGKDKFTEEFILSKLLNGSASITTNTNNTVFVIWTENTNQIMAEVENIR